MQAIQEIKKPNESSYRFHDKRRMCPSWKTVFLRYWFVMVHAFYLFVDLVCGRARSNKRRLTVKSQR